VWNVGQPPDKEFGGGTYGYGKSVHFLASGAHTILLHTRCQTRDGPESRLIACAWGEEFALARDDSMVPYTGRHWWGASSPDPELPVTPVTGEDADRIASALGLLDLGHGGTSIMVLAADVSDHDAWGQTVADAVAWHCWPKLVDVGAGPDMTIDVNVNGARIPVPDPTTHPELSILVSCLRQILHDSAGAAHKVPITLQRPATRTGWLALQRHMDRTADESTGARPFDGPLRHVALMRAPRLVVRYLPGPEPPAPFVGWGGVFLVDDEHDRSFALAEPPAHDDWVPKAVELKPQRRIVNVSLQRVREAVRDFVAPRSAPQEGESHGLGALSDRLGDLLPIGGPGAVERLRSPGPGGSTRRSSARVERHRLVGTEDGLVLVAEVSVTLRDRVDRGVLSMQVDVATSDGAGVERDAPEGAAMPSVLGWEDPAGGWSPLSTVTVSHDQLDGWRARVLIPRDTAIVLRPHCEEDADG
jgi:hypothetical protein